MNYGQFAVISLQFRHLQDLIICDKCISSLKDLREINNERAQFASPQKEQYNHHFAFWWLQINVS